MDNKINEILNKIGKKNGEYNEIKNNYEKIKHLLNTRYVHIGGYCRTDYINVELPERIKIGVLLEIMKAFENEGEKIIAEIEELKEEFKQC